MINTQPNSRLIAIFLVFVSFYLIVAINLYILQIRQTQFFSQLGRQQYNVTVTHMPPRAEIYDRSGAQPLAMNKESLSAFITPNNIENEKELKKFLKRNFGASYERFEKNSQQQFMYIKRRLTDAQVELIQKSNLSDIKLLKEPSRYYPVESVGPIVGITDIDNQGIVGIEQLCNNHLAGTPSTSVLEKDARSGLYFKQETKIEGSFGQPVTLTIDSNLQFLVYEELKETVKALGSKEGAVLIINPENGEIMVMANYPDFDPNNTENLDIEKTKNRIAIDSYELGSVIKIFLALAALEEGVVTEDELIDCENTKSYSIHGMPFTTWKAHGVITFSEVIEGSNNIGVAKVAQRLGTKLYDHYLRLGFGQKIGILPGENKGFINPPAQWSKASLISLSFGYEISATLLQLAQAMGIISNNGYLVPLKLIKEENTKKVLGKRLYKPEVIEVIKKILRKTVTDGNSNRGNIEGYCIMGKTGTARLITNGKYDSNRHIFTFAGLIEMNSYKRIIITFIKETTQKNPYASTTAAPLFEIIAKKMLIHDKII